MKRLSYILIIIGFLSSCTTFKSIKCGSPSTNTYLNFAVDTIATYDTIRDIQLMAN